MKESLQDQARRLKAGLPHVRGDGRKPEELRPLSLALEFTMHAEGSVLVSVGNTRVICTASLEDKVPPFLRGKGEGWVTAEYGMLPRATHTRTQREVSKGRPSGRTAEIQRLIGRSLRSVVDLRAMGENTVWIDCDVIQADGGTRCASITGGFVALVLALRKLGERVKFRAPPVKRYVSAVSLGWLDGQVLLDLNYEEDRAAEVDLNVVMTDALHLIEIQGTAEGDPFPRDVLSRMLDLAEVGIRHLTDQQKDVLGGRLV
jgi:ribonuclease PH